MEDLDAQIAGMSDDDLLAQINGFDPYDVEFARRFRAQAARIEELERERDQVKRDFDTTWAVDIPFHQEKYLSEREARLGTLAQWRVSEARADAAEAEVARLSALLKEAVSGLYEVDRFLSHPLDPDDVVMARDETRAILARIAQEPGQ